MSKFDLFHLWENLSYKSWGLFTFFDLTEEEILQRKEKVVKILEKYSWIELEQTEDWEVLIDDFWYLESRKKRIMWLLEENSILLDSLFYLSSNIMKKWTCIDDIIDEIEFLSSKKYQPNFIHYYNFVDLIIWDIVKDLESTIENWYVFNDPQMYIAVWELIIARRDFLDPINWLEELDDIIMQ